jgi:hypothetical protein
VLCGSVGAGLQLHSLALQPTMRFPDDEGESDTDMQYPGTPLLWEHVDERRARACQHILAAYMTSDPIHIRRTPAARRVQKAIGWLSNFEWISLLGLVALSVFERPVWCIALQVEHGGTYPCDTDDYPGWGHAFLYLNEAFLWEFICLATQLLFLGAHVFAGVHPCEFGGSAKQTAGWAAAPARLPSVVLSLLRTTVASIPDLYL